MIRKTILFLISIMALFFGSCTNLITDTQNEQVEQITSWGNGRGNPQNSGFASVISTNVRSIKSRAVQVNTDWIFIGSGSPNGSFSVIDEEGTIYYQGTDKCIYAVKKDGTLKWKAVNKNYGFVPPVIGPDGRIYVGDYQDWFYCLNPIDGTEIWSKDFGNIGSGFVNAPIITQEGIIYVSSWDGNLYAMNLNGDVIWTFNQAYSVQGTPGVGINGNVYTMTDRLYSLDPSDGNVNWTFLPDSEPDTMGWQFESTPVIAGDDTIYIIGYYQSMMAMENIIYLFAIDETGNEKWRYQLTDGTSISISGTRTYPALMSDGTILISVSATNSLVALNPNGSLKTEKIFSYNLADEASPSIDSSGNIYISYRYGFACLSPDISTVLWESIISDGSNSIIVESSPSIGQDSVYFTCREGNTGGSLYSFPLDF